MRGCLYLYDFYPLGLGQNEENEGKRFKSRVLRTSSLKISICLFLLEIRDEPSVEDIKKIWEAKALETHLDKNHDDVKEANARFQVLQSAYQTFLFNIEKHSIPFGVDPQKLDAKDSYDYSEDSFYATESDDSESEDEKNKHRPGPSTFVVDPNTLTAEGAPHDKGNTNTSQISQRKEARSELDNLVRELKQRPQEKGMVEIWDRLFRRAEQTRHQSKDREKRAEDERFTEWAGVEKQLEETAKQRWARFDAKNNKLATAADGCTAVMGSSTSNYSNKANRHRTLTVSSGFAAAEEEEWAVEDTRAEIPLLDGSDYNNMNAVEDLRRLVDRISGHRNFDILIAKEYPEYKRMDNGVDELSDRLR
ncbi:hypothetical protein BJ878DRAFT_475782 [Calycina marina]|uniref:J domain-containing protein n=1 Tax=Calycina marina TaxID=1763456 RepID=A0A9P8CJN5_9HELO|nr:hypothetical protein BJ878DRAFT_475782 [Calycina marina]